MKTLKTKISPKCILLLKKKILLVPVYSVFASIWNGNQSPWFQNKWCMPNNLWCKNYLRFYVEYIFLKILYQILYSCGVCKHRQDFMYSGNPHGISYKCVDAQEFSWLFTKMDPHVTNTHPPTHPLYSNTVFLWCIQAWAEFMYSGNPHGVSYKSV